MVRLVVAWLNEWWGMRVLIVESSADLSGVWARHLERQGAEVFVLADAAIDWLRTATVDVVVANLIQTSGSALALADVTALRSPGTSVVFVTDTSFFSDGSIFSITSNARALLQSDTKPEDLAEMVLHYASAPPHMASEPTAAAN